MENITLFTNVKDGVVITNMEEVRETLVKGLEEYKGMVFTEDSKTDAKKAVADLRKLRKEVKEKIMAPYTLFEEQVKEINALIDEPIDFINAQVQEFERKRVDEKRALIADIYNDVVRSYPEVVGILTLERIYNSKWENATTTKKAVEEEITARVEHVAKDLTTIHDVGSEFAGKGVAAYKKTLELSDAVSVINACKEQKREIMEQIKEETHVDVPRPQDEASKKPTGVIYEVEADLFQTAQLEAFMKENGIIFRRL